MKTLTTQPASADAMRPSFSPALALRHGFASPQALSRALQAAAPVSPAAGFALPAAPAYTRHRYDDSFGYRTIESSDAKGNAISLQTPHLGDPARDWNKPGLWYGDETRIDAQGREWRRTLKSYYVMDDFGNLVAVPA